MIVRNASRFDIEAILQMLRQYQNNTPLDFLRDVDDANYITQMLHELMAGKGLILVADTGKEIAGMLIAGIMPSIWSPKHWVLTEWAYYVAPEHRGGTAGYRLLKSYLEAAIELKEAGRICHAFISKMSNSPDLKYSKFGFEKLEEFWVM